MKKWILLFAGFSGRLRKYYKEIALLAVLTLFLTGSYHYIRTPIWGHRSEYRSSSLRMIMESSETQERTDYVDQDGRITIAANLGYATKIITKMENAELEQYYDANGFPIERYTHYYALLREYDENSKNYRITYLDGNLSPVVIYGGYAIEERAFDEQGRIISIRYLNENGDPVCTPSYGYGKTNEYNEDGKVKTITYVDESGNPMITKLGYACIVSEFYKTADQNNGRIESEFYYDENGIPISLSLGQYGVHKEYDENGQVSLMTYLDVEGQPMVTTKGYTTVVRTFHPDDSVATEFYYDLEGNPYELPEGQYGVGMENGQKTYLDIEGREQFNIKNILYKHSSLVVMVALFAVLLSGSIQKKGNSILLFLYICTIIYFTLMFREDGDSQADLGIFRSVTRFFYDSGVRADILKNIWLFIPLGAILFQLYGKPSILLVSVALSIAIEMVQYYTGTGLCELVDIISNSLGGAIGYGMEALFTRMKPQSHR